MKFDMGFKCPKCNTGKLFLYNKKNDHPTSKESIHHLGCSWCELVLPRIEG